MRRGLTWFFCLQCAFLASTSASAPPETVGASLYYTTPGASVIGGGAGFGDYCQPNKPTIFNLEDLRAVPRAGARGDVFYIDDSAVIDLTCEYPIVIPAGVTLCSGRGRNGSEGARLIKSVAPEGAPNCDDPGRTDIIEMREGSRLSGLRLDGMDPAIGDGAYDTPLIVGIEIQDANASANDQIVVENSEFSGFSYYAVGTDSFSDNANGEWSVLVRNNYFHHNRRQGLGYGVAVFGNSRVIIEANYFDFNRHDIAGSGNPGQGYIARYNVVGAGGTSHNFDMHPEGGAESESPNAGDYVEIRDNTFSLTEHPNIRIGGIPSTPSHVRNNLFPTSVGLAVHQRTVGNLTIANNQGNASPWFVSESGAKSWRLINASTAAKELLAFGNFVGDEKMDAITSDGSRWYVSENATHPWTILNYSGAVFSSLRFVDVTGDARTDVLAKEAGQWLVSDGGAAPWQISLYSGTPLSQLLFGNVVGSNKDDAILFTGSQWHASDSASGSWQTVNYSSAVGNQVLLGDVIGDSRDDIIFPTGSQWHVSDGGHSSWQTLNYSSAGVTSLAVGDFVGDSKDDIVTSAFGTWYVSESGSSAWQYLNSSGQDITRLDLVDLVGNEKDDVFLMIEVN